MTIGGYSDQDMNGGYEGIEWYENVDVNSVQYDTWMLEITSMNISGTDLLSAPESDDSVDSKTERLVNDDTAFINYAHFNTGYPFLGVDENVGAILEADFKAKRPDVDCEYN